MNVTIKIDDQLCKEARHRAVDADLSLSGWIATLIEKEVRGEAGPNPRAKAAPIRLLDLLGDERAAAIEFEAPRFLESPKGADLDVEISA